jgi:methionyl-tRNA formyltransferase
MARVAFLGTPQSAVPTLETLAEEHEIALVVTQPDRPRGRSKSPQPPPVKETAIRLGIPVAQPGKRSEIEGALRESGPFEIAVVVAYGRILTPEVLALPTHGILNLHFSLLPRWRGAAPVARALMAGDPMTGVTIMKLDEGLDTGPILTAQAVDIGQDENAGELTKRLARSGARLLDEAMTAYLAGELEPVPQTDEGVTYADKIEARDRPISPADPVDRVLGQIRGLAPTPAATLDIAGQPHKVLAARRSEVSPPQGEWQIIDGAPIIGLADGGVEILTIQPPGKTPREGRAWANGLRQEGGTLG